MNRRLGLILLLFTLVLIVILIGDYIHIFFTKKGIDYVNRDAYSKINKEDLVVLIEVDKKRLSIIDTKANKVLKSYAVATGKADTLTPLGTFKIIKKAKWGEGFGSRWLGLNVPWGNYGIHGTNRPGSIGYDVSGGCIRMRNTDVEELYSFVDYNTTVAIINGNYGPFGYGLRELRPGDRGADVLEVQKRLLIKGHYKGSLDGIYGEDMKGALIEYLKAVDIPLTDAIDDELYKRLGIILID